MCKLNSKLPIKNFMKITWADSNYTNPENINWQSPVQKPSVPPAWPTKATATTPGFHHQPNTEHDLNDSTPSHRHPTGPQLPLHELLPDQQTSAPVNSAPPDMTPWSASWIPAQTPDLSKALHHLLHRLQTEPGSHPPPLMSHLRFPQYCVHTWSCTNQSDHAVNSKFHHIQHNAWVTQHSLALVPHQHHPTNPWDRSALSPPLTPSGHLRHLHQCHPDEHKPSPPHHLPLSLCQMLIFPFPDWSLLPPTTATNTSKIKFLLHLSNVVPH